MTGYDRKHVVEGAVDLEHMQTLDVSSFR